jgi:hypothetical protein
MQSLHRSKIRESSNGSMSNPRKFSENDFFQTCCPEPVSHRIRVDGRCKASNRCPLFSPKFPSSHNSSGIGRLPSDSRHFTSPWCRIFKTFYFSSPAITTNKLECSLPASVFLRFVKFKSKVANIMAQLKDPQRANTSFLPGASV